MSYLLLNQLVSDTIAVFAWLDVATDAMLAAVLHSILAAFKQLAYFTVAAATSLLTLCDAPFFKTVPGMIIGLAIALTTLLFLVTIPYAVHVTLNRYIEQKRKFRSVLYERMRTKLNTRANHLQLYYGRVYIHRTHYESQLAAHYFNPDIQATGAYLVVYGTAACGKSTLIQHMASNRLGVVYVYVSFLTTTTKMLIDCIAGTSLNQDDRAWDNDAYALAVAVHKASISLGMTAAIVFDVRRSGMRETITAEKDMLSVVRQLAKALCGVAHVVVVVSDTNAILAFKFFASAPHANRPTHP